MKNLDAAFTARLQAARGEGIEPVRLVWITARDRMTGAQAEIGFWTGDGEIRTPADITSEQGFGFAEEPVLTLDFPRMRFASDTSGWAKAYAAEGQPPALVLDPARGIYGVTAEDDTAPQLLRRYIGGVNLTVGDISYVSDLTIQSVEISLSQIAEAAQYLLRGFDARLARVEIHEMTLDPETGLFAAAPELVFLGLIDQAPLTTPAAEGEGAITLTAISEPISMLSRINPRKSSYHGQAQRQNDQWGRYASSISSWNLKWGTS
ncbi:hypothetical protein [Phaeovulum sp. W22_SRMD_FR3]|uniref:hypothetical protein n=1 Tax=Phaeovulum sp. W22_SRMD_FR3 TaxID=3240274 RepID=UPI003F9E3E4D